MKQYVHVANNLGNAMVNLLVKGDSKWKNEIVNNK